MEDGQLSGSLDSCVLHSEGRVLTWVDIQYTEHGLCPILGTEAKTAGHNYFKDMSSPQ